MTLLDAVVIGVVIGGTIAVTTVIFDEVRGYLRMKRFSAQAQKNRGGRW